jgi:hypothetical protein
MIADIPFQPSHPYATRYKQRIIDDIKKNNDRYASIQNTVLLILFVLTTGDISHLL